MNGTKTDALQALEDNVPIETIVAITGISRATIYRWKTGAQHQKKLMADDLAPRLSRAELNWKCPGCGADNTSWCRHRYDQTQCSKCQRSYFWETLLGKTRYYKLTNLMPKHKDKT
jgi:transposase-like protein